MASKNKNQELVNDVAKYFNGAESLYEASKVVYKQLELDLLRETVHKLSIALMKLNKIQSHEYDEERKKVWDLKDELKKIELEDNESVDYTVRFKVHDALLCVRSSVMFGKNYHRDF